MCWDGKVKDKRMASRNMTVYKILEKFGRGKNKSYRSPFQLYEYTMGSSYMIEDGLYVHKHFEYASIYEGLHCYSPNAYARFKSEYQSLSVYNSTCSDLPLYHYDFGFQRSPYKCVVVKCTIPKGATYYINERGEIVTDKLILDCELGIPTNTSPLRFRELYKNNLFR